MGNSLSLERHVNYLVCSCFKLRNIAKLWHVVSRAEAEMIYTCISPPILTIVIPFTAVLAIHH